MTKNIIGGVFMIKKIMIVDDSMFLRNSLRSILESSGMEVVGEAENGIDAISKYKKLNPDIVTMDITMPQLDGIETIKILKDLDKNIKVVVVSSFGSEETVRKAIIAGAKSFILKPFDANKVIETVNRL